MHTSEQKSKYLIATSDEFGMKSVDIELNKIVMIMEM